MKRMMGENYHQHYGETVLKPPEAPTHTVVIDIHIPDTDVEMEAHDAFLREQAFMPPQMLKALEHKYEESGEYPPKYPRGVKQHYEGEGST